MNKAIWKFPLRITDHQSIPMPSGAKPLSVMMQDEQLTVWAMVDPNAPKVQHEFVVRGTGRPCHETDGVYLASVPDREFIWHIFDSGEVK